MASKLKETRFLCGAGFMDLKVCGFNGGGGEILRSGQFIHNPITCS